MIMSDNMKSEYLEYLNRKYGEELKKFGFILIETPDYESGGRFSVATYHLDRYLDNYIGGYLEIYVDNKKKKITNIDLELFDLRTPKYYHITSKSMSNLLSVLRNIKLEHDKERMKA